MAGVIASTSNLFYCTRQRFYSIYSIYFSHPAIDWCQTIHFVTLLKNHKLFSQIKKKFRTVFSYYQAFDLIVHYADTLTCGKKHKSWTLITLTKFFTKYFNKVSQIHSRVTSSCDNNMLYLPRYRSNCKRSFKYRGVKT